jgi:hypothetical protein
MLLGEATFSLKKNDDLETDDNDISKESSDLSKQAKIWMRQNNITLDELEQVFHISTINADVIASSIPGKGGKVKSINAYVLERVSKFLISGDSSFGDKSARALCQRSGCYHMKHHVEYLKDKGNKFTGSKDSGWKLTSPRLKHGAELVKEIANV